MEYQGHGVPGPTSLHSHFRNSQPLQIHTCQFQTCNCISYKLQPSVSRSILASSRLPFHVWCSVQFKRQWLIM
jgi:hypothetical protein